MLFVNSRAIIERNITGITYVLIQVRNKPNEPLSYEFPGGRIEEFESIEEALRREVFEETGLKITRIKDETNRKIHRQNDIHIETLHPFFVYQTTQGPVDSIGFIFRCEVETGEAMNTIEASGHKWISLNELENMFMENKDQFDWLTQGIINHYLNWVKFNFTV